MTDYIEEFLFIENKKLKQQMHLVKAQTGNNLNVYGKFKKLIFKISINWLPYIHENL